MNKNGFSLIEILIVLAISAIISLAMSTLFSQTMSVQKNAALGLEMTNRFSQILRVLNDRDLCTSGLKMNGGVAKIPPELNKVLPLSTIMIGNEVLASLNDSFANLGTNELSLRVIKNYGVRKMYDVANNLVDRNKLLVELKIQWKKMGGGLGPSFFLPRTITFIAYTETGSNIIDNCISQDATTAAQITCEEFAGIYIPNPAPGEAHCKLPSSLSGVLQSNSIIDASNATQTIRVAYRANCSLVDATNNIYRWIGSGAFGDQRGSGGVWWDEPAHGSCTNVKWNSTSNSYDYDWHGAGSYWPGAGPLIWVGGGTCRAGNFTGSGKYGCPQATSTAGCTNNWHIISGTCQ